MVLKRVGGNVSESPVGLGKAGRLASIDDLRAKGMDASGKNMYRSDINDQ